MVFLKDMITPAATVTARIIAAAILLYPVIAVFAPKGMTVLLVFPALLSLMLRQNRIAVFKGMPRVALVILAALAMWSVVTVWWAPRPLDALELWFRVVAIGLCGILLIAAATKTTALSASDTDRRLLVTSLVVSGWMFVALFGFELVTDGFISGLVRSLWTRLTPWTVGPPRADLFLLQASAALVMFAWPCIAALARRHSTSIAVLYAAVVGVLLSIQNMEAALLAFASGVVVFAVVCRFKRKGVAVVLIGLALVNVALVLAALEIISSDQQDGFIATLSGGVRERLHIIDYVYARISENPLIGWGFDGSRAIGQGLLGGFGSNKAIPLHPHNIWAQTWLELGFIGLFLVVSLVVSVALHVFADGKARGSIAVAAMISYLLIGNISYGMWQNWWLAIAWLNIAFFTVAWVCNDAEGSPEDS